ncbi:endolytic transglycosylase MltG [Thaumasiovibrio sp. DFM-14]|uniref:endolytic transglycosylase MltG n=1 Tax=Thaumasiovibrio sp. DFM-14 TaxID=3384792 RepID=UPI0039A3C15A
MIKRLLLVLAIFAVIAAAGAYWAVNQVKLSSSSPLLIEQETLLTVAPGSHLATVVRQFEQQGWIEESPWRQYIRHLRPELSAVKAGTYMLTQGMHFDDALALIVRGDEHQFSITLLEGERFIDWLALLQQTPYLVSETATMTEAEIAKVLGASNEKLEGLLLPETYYFTYGTSDLTLLKRAYRAMDTLLSNTWDSRDKGLMLKTPYEVLIMASIIEKETALAEERGLVSSVFNNRLKKGMRLQTDPTVIYGMGDSYRGVITRSALRTPTPYNTYTIAGLPPTPIAMPGRDSVLAALNPPDSNYYYFVADTKGGHTFSTTLEQHNRAVRVYRQWERSQR